MQAEEEKVMFNLCKSRDGQTDRQTDKHSTKKGLWKFRGLEAWKLRICQTSKLPIFQASSCLAFTLAEVLITLGVIGIVAAISIPQVVVKYQKAQTLSQLKKVYSVLNNAYNKAILENGDITSWGLTGAENSSGLVSAYQTILAPNLNIARYCGTNNTNNLCWQGGRVSYQSNVYFMLNDGTSVVLEDNTYSVFRFNIYVDLNGLKHPNRWGKDRFIFQIGDGAISYSYKIYPYGKNPYSMPGRTACWDTNATLPGWMTDASPGDGKTCGLTIIYYDNWQIADDYAW